MSVEEANDFLGEDHSPQKAFEKVKPWYHFDMPKEELISQVPKEDLERAACVFFTVGLAYLANRAPHRLLQDIGPQYIPGLLLFILLMIWLKELLN